MTASQSCRATVAHRREARWQLWRQAFAGLDLRGKVVLDAGTGEGYFTRFLAEQEPAHLVSITCVPDEIPAAQQVLAELALRVDFRVAQLDALHEIPDQQFDVVGADYLIAAAYAYSPYREIECLQELVRILKPGGRLVVTGWEVWREPRHSVELPMRRLFQIREAIHHLADTPPFREHPASWVAARLQDLHLPPERIIRIPDMHYEFDWFVANVKHNLSLVEGIELRQALENQIDPLAEQLRRAPVLQTGYHFGDLYAVLGCKLAGAILLGG